MAEFQPSSMYGATDSNGERPQCQNSAPHIRRSKHWGNSMSSLLSCLQLAVHLYVCLHVARQVQLGGVLRGEGGVAVPPATLEGLQVRVAVVGEQVLQEVLPHAKDQRATVPPAAVVLHQVEFHGLDGPVVAACVDHALMDGHTHHHVMVAPVHLQPVVGL